MHTGGVCAHWWCVSSSVGVGVGVGVCTHLSWTPHLAECAYTAGVRGGDLVVCARTVWGVVVVCVHTGGVCTHMGVSSSVGVGVGVCTHLSWTPHIKF